MKRARVYNFLLTLTICTGLSLPFVLQQTTKVTPLLSIIILCITAALYMERSITFRVMKEMDSLKWINDDGTGGLYILTKLFMAICIVAMLVVVFQDINQLNLLLLWSGVHGSFLVDNNKIHIGENFIYTQGRYIKISDVTSYQQKEVKKGKLIHYTAFVIKTNKGTYNLNFRGTREQGIDILAERLSTS